jgi:hypothetical protein
MVDRSTVDQPKKTVAMSAIRALEDDAADPMAAMAALFPMILDMYLDGDTETKIDAAITAHGRTCRAALVAITPPPPAQAATPGTLLISSLGKLGWPGVAIFALIRLPELAQFLQGFAYQ